MEEKEMSAMQRAEAEYKHYLANREGRPSGAMDDIAVEKQDEQAVADVKPEEEVVDEAIESVAEEGISEEEQALRERSTEYAFSREGGEEVLAEVKADAKALKADMLKNPEIHSLSLPQIGKKKRMFAMRHGNDIRIYVNPVIQAQRGLFLVAQKEECMPEQIYIIFRPAEITIAYTTIKGECKETDLIGLAAAEYVKQCERLDGILLWDFGKRCDRWDSLSPRNKEKVTNEYLEDLRAALHYTQKVVDNDAELKEMTQKYEKIKEEMRQELQSEIKKHDADMRQAAKKEREKKRATSIWNA